MTKGTLVAVHRTACTVLTQLEHNQPSKRVGLFASYNVHASFINAVCHPNNAKSGIGRSATLTFDQLAVRVRVLIKVDWRRVWSVSFETVWGSRCSAQQLVFSP